MKMGVVAVIGVCVIFYQYHLSNGVRFDQLTDFNSPDPASPYAAANIPGSELYDYNGAHRISEETVKRSLIIIFHLHIHLQSARNNYKIVITWKHKFGLKYSLKANAYVDVIKLHQIMNVRRLETPWKKECNDLVVTR